MKIRELKLDLLRKVIVFKFPKVGPIICWF